MRIAARPRPMFAKHCGNVHGLKGRRDTPARRGQSTPRAAHRNACTQRWHGGMGWDGSGGCSACGGCILHVEGRSAELDWFARRLGQPREWVAGPTLFEPRDSSTDEKQPPTAHLALSGAAGHHAVPAGAICCHAKLLAGNVWQKHWLAAVVRNVRHRNGQPHAMHRELGGA